MSLSLYNNNNNDLKIKSNNSHLPTKKQSRSAIRQLLFDHQDHNYPQKQTPKLLEGLGKATKRGIRACPKCGIINGTRGVKCKNGECKYNFKQVTCESDGNNLLQLLSKKTEEDEAELSKSYRVSRILSEEKFYSVEKILNTSGDFGDWGFVHLPLLEEVNSVISEDDKGLVAYQLMAFCYMRDCISSNLRGLKSKRRKHDSRSYNESIGFCCDHVKAAFLTKNCINSVCNIDSNILDTICLPKETKLHLTKLTCLENEINPVVQKISDSIYIVKGLPDANHSIGLSYVSFSKEVVAVDDSNDVENKEGDYLNPGNRDDDNTRVCLTCWCGLKLNMEFFKESTYQPCLNLFACLIALASDREISKSCVTLLSATNEYYKQINLVQESLLCRDVLSPTTSPNLLSSVSIDDALMDHEGNGSDEKLRSTLDDEEVLEILRRVPKQELKSEKVNKNTKSHRKPNFGHIITDGHLSTATSNNIKNSANESVGTSVSFNDWMTFVVEAIGESMHYQCCGKPPPLKFHVHERFFDILLDRIVMTNQRKKRLPDSLESIKISPPLPGPHGSFNRYVWHLHNAHHVQQIFSTSLSQLELSRIFIENNDGTYSKFQKTKEDVNGSSFGKPHIQPFYLKTQLKIGHDLDDASSNASTPFTIEWIPDVYKLSDVGELTLKFEFSRYKKGKLLIEDGNKPFPMLSTM